ncbi:MAG: hypothetical protein ACO3SP_00870 [Ilumatobacteraceae bacterium]
MIPAAPVRVLDVVVTYVRDSPSRWGERFVVPFTVPAAQVVGATAFVTAVKDEPAENHIPGR